VTRQTYYETTRLKTDMISERQRGEAQQQTRLTNAKSSHPVKFETPLYPSFSSWNGTTGMTSE
jgi:hypothetical protein